MPNDLQVSPDCCSTTLLKNATYGLRRADPAVVRFYRHIRPEIKNDKEQIRVSEAIPGPGNNFRLIRQPHPTGSLNGSEWLVHARQMACFR